MLTVGLTGGVASGKSAAAEMLRGLGAATLDADRVVERLYRVDGAGAAAVAELFGAAMLDDEGGVDRPALAALVLEQAEHRRRLEAAIHPLVRDQVAAWLGKLENDEPPPTVAVVEAALLVETGAYRDYDRTVVVSAPLEARQRRALAAGWPAQRFARTAAAQTTDTRRESVADYVVSNGGDMAALQDAVARLWEVLLADAALKERGEPLPPRPRAG